MKKKFAAFILCVLCLLSAVGCAQKASDTADVSAQTTETLETDYLTSISGTYVELFPEMSKSEYRNIWIDAATPLVGAENAETATDMLLGMCMAEPYGPEAAEKYAADPDSMAFNCYFLGGFDTSRLHFAYLSVLQSTGSASMKDLHHVLSYTQLQHCLPLHDK